MVNSVYAKSYTEVLTLLKCLSKEEYSKIPKEEIDFLEENCDKLYKFKLDKSKKLTEQNVSRETNAVLVVLFQKYFASEEQKDKLKTILMQNYENDEEKKRELYSNKEIFQSKNEQLKETQMIEYREDIITRLINYIKKFWKRIFY